MTAPSRVSSEEERTTGENRRAVFAAPELIRVVPLHPDPPSRPLLQWLAAELGSRLCTTVVVDAPLESPTSWRPGDDGQLSSGAIVDSLMERFPAAGGGDANWVLGVATSDLRGGGRDYVFGEATFGGAWAVVSLARLGAAGGPQFRSRLLRESLHELGHLAGLRHCRERACLMAPAIRVEDIDAAGVSPCPICSSPTAGT